MSVKKIIFGLFCLLAINFELQAQPFKGCPKGNETISVTNESFEQQVLALVNKERAKRKLKPLQLDPNLTASARYHAADMATDAYFSHDTYDKNGQRQCGTFERIVKFAGKYFGAMAENISAGDSSPAGVMQSWMGSAGHKANILNKNYTHIGIGYFYNANDKEQYYHYWAQSFGKKK
jgi:uncharacterized protein YkwD